MANPIAVPGTVVPSGSLTTPGGAQGVQGPTAVSTDTGNIATLGSDSKILVPKSTIWSIRQKSFNSIGNPTFEADQVNVGNQIVVGPGGYVRAIDRWYAGNSLAAGGPNFFVGQSLQNNVVPGTSFLISNRVIGLTFAVQKTSLVAGDMVYLSQSVEGCNFRELINDVSSFSILATTNVSGGLKFAVSLRDNVGGTSANSITHLCTIPSANTLTLITWPNIPKFPGGGTWGYTPGVGGYYFNITVACGTTYMAPAADTWQTGNFLGAPGMDNFYSKAINSTLQIGFVQHEPGPDASGLIDCPFTQNLDACLRYYAKSFPYATKPPFGANTGAQSAMPGPVTFPRTSLRWPKLMAKTPTVSLYSPNSGAVGTVFNDPAGTNISATPADISDAGMASINTPSGVSTGQNCMFHWIADTGW